jgi:hypothetical protein
LYPLTANARYGNLDVSSIIETLAIKPYYSGSYAKEWTFVSSNLDASTKESDDVNAKVNPNLGSTALVY